MHFGSGEGGPGRVLICCGQPGPGAGRDWSLLAPAGPCWPLQGSPAGRKQDRIPVVRGCAASLDLSIAGIMTLR